MLDGVPSEELFNELALDMLRNELIYLGKIEYKTVDEAYGCLVEEDETDETNKNEEQ